MSVHARITDRPLDPTALCARVAGPGAGALVLFCGTVRNETAGRAVVALEYEAYAPMAERVLREIAETARARHGCHAVAVEHRVGRLEVGDVSVAIATSAPHRAQAYDASREVIERLKREAPIWKREVYADGASAWVGTPGEPAQAESAAPERAAE